MGFLRDALGSALGADRVQNGFNGPRLTFSDGKGQTSMPRSGAYGRYNANEETSSSLARSLMLRYESTAQNLRSSKSSQHFPISQHGSSDQHYDRRSKPLQLTSFDMDKIDSDHDSLSWSQRVDGERRPEFRPFALPQIQHGDGKPFLRGYSNELDDYDIPDWKFVEILDSLNAAVTPSPEVQIFQKGANIAGWFIPGFASLGLMAGQIAVDLGSNFGHANMVARVLSKANTDVFLPRGLEICIGRTKDINAEAGISSFSFNTQDMMDASPQDRLAMYGASLAPLSRVLPPLNHSGRSDPIAAVGQQIGDRDTQRKLKRAHKKMDRGRSKGIESLEDSLEWLMVRRASPDALAHWQKVSQQSQEALRQDKSSSRYERDQ